MLSDARIITSNVTRTRLEELNPDWLADMVESKRQFQPSILGVTQTQTATAPSALVTVAYGETGDIPEQFRHWDIIQDHPRVIRPTSPTSTPVSFLSSLLQRQRRDERLKRLSPERRAMYEDIRKLREEIGPIDFNVVEALRELRGDE
jgi:hypothetical protein